MRNILKVLIYQPIQNENSCIHKHPEQTFNLLVMYFMCDFEWER